MIKQIKAKFLAKDARGEKVQKNILVIILLQGISVLTSFLLVPLTIDYVSASEYGIWLTISSIVGWFSLVDIGMGSGLKNKLTEALAKNDTILAKKYVSTTYISLGVFVTLIFSVLLAVIWFIDWSMILNQPESMRAMLTETMFIVIAFFALRMIVSLISMVLTAHMLPAASTAINTVSNLLVLLVIFILAKLIPGDLRALALVLSGISVLIYILVTFLLFGKKYRDISPSWRYFDRKEMGSLLNLGFGFFFIKISMILLFQTSNIMIIRWFSNEDVVVYNIAYKLFSVGFILFDMLVQPYWAAFTDAWVKKDTEWIQDSVTKLLRTWKAISLCCIAVLLLSPVIYKIWIGGSVHIPFILSAAMCLYFICRCYGGTYNMFINGTGKIRIQSITLGIMALLYIPLAYLLAKVLGIGLIAIPLSLIATDVYSLFVARIHYRRLMEGKATGLWNK